MNNVKRIPKRGRAKSKIVRQDTQSLLSSAVALNRKLTVATDIRITTQTLRNQIDYAGLRDIRDAVRPPLNIEHRNRRLHCAQDHVKWAIVISSYPNSTLNCRIYIFSLRLV